MLLDQILVMCLLLIGSHGNMSPDSKITRSKGPSDAMSLPRGTHPNTSQEVNQAQTHSGLDSRLQALVSLIIIETLLTIVLLLHCEWHKIHTIHARACKLKIHVSPLSNQKAQNLGKLREIRWPFSNSDHGKWNSQNLQQIAQNLLNLPTVTANHAKFTQFASISQGSLYPRAKLPKLVAIRALGKLRKFCRPFSDLEHGKWNSQNLQQIAQNLLNLPTVTANHAKFAQFASISQDSLYPQVELSNFTIFVYRCNFVDFSF